MTSETDNQDDNELDGEARLKIWRAPAYDKARGGSPEYRVASFLRQKGVPNDLARQAAAELVAQARREKVKLAIPKLVLGWGMILFGIAFSLNGLFSDGSSWIIAFGPIVLGFWVLYGRRAIV